MTLFRVAYLDQYKVDTRGPSSSCDSGFMSVAVQFPQTQPPGYEWLDDEPPFDPQVHLQLEMPARVVMLTDLGYTEDEIDGKATPLAASDPFRLLSDEGVAVMAETARRLETFVKPAGDRIERMVRGGCYRSRWLRDLCISPEACAHMSAIYGTPVAPHPMPLHLGHLNYAPTAVDVGIDKWHHDTLPLDYVLMVTDPSQVAGGRFEYFVGTKDQAAILAAQGLTPPPERVVAPQFPGAGWAVALHGDMVVHRAGPIHDLCDRTTMVNGYVALDARLQDQSRSVDLLAVDDPNVLYTEWAKFAAWRSKERLGDVIESLDFGADVESVAHELESAVTDVLRAVAEMRGGQVDTAHYEK